MPDLNEQIQSWRQSVSRSGALKQDDLDELEEHLRESIAELTAAGLSEEEGFLVAQHRLGTADAISVEFSKVNSLSFWCNRLQWLWAGYIVGSIYVRFLSGFSLNPVPTVSPRFVIAMLFNGLILGLFYLIPYANLLRKPIHSIQGESEPSKSFMALLASIVSFVVIGIPVFFCMSVTVAQHLAPDLGVHRFWVGKISQETYGISVLVILFVSLPPALAFGFYAARQTYYRWGNRKQTEQLSEA